ncbi:unnamed protein product [Closterium sp. NIES-65]|nr:unnamed protein product [Closterium sp. NIES-65]
MSWMAGLARISGVRITPVRTPARGRSAPSAEGARKRGGLLVVRAVGDHQLAPLPYQLDALEPHVSRSALEAHWSGHHGRQLAALNRQLDADLALKRLPLEELVKVAYNGGNPLPCFNLAAEVGEVGGRGRSVDVLVTRIKMVKVVNPILCFNLAARDLLGIQRGVLQLLFLFPSSPPHSYPLSATPPSHSPSPSPHDRHAITSSSFRDSSRKPRQPEQGGGEPARGRGAAIAPPPSFLLNSPFSTLPSPTPRQAWNHEFFFSGLQPADEAEGREGGNRPEGEVLRLVERDFGSVEGFQREFRQACALSFGSGYVWLSGNIGDFLEAGGHGWWSGNSGRMRGSRGIFDGRVLPLMARDTFGSQEKTFEMSLKLVGSGGVGFRDMGPFEMRNIIVLGLLFLLSLLFLLPFYLSVSPLIPPPPPLIRLPAKVDTVVPEEWLADMRVPNTYRLQVAHLRVERTVNAFNPLVFDRIHSYLSDYPDNRSAYVEAFLQQLMSWDAVAARVDRAKSLTNFWEMPAPPDAFIRPGFVLLQICASISALLLQSPGTAADLEARLAAATSAAEGGGGGGGEGGAGNVWGMMGGVVELLGAVGDECTDEQRWSVGVVTLQRKHVFAMEVGEWGEKWGGWRGRGKCAWDDTGNVGVVVTQQRKHVFTMEVSEWGEKGYLGVSCALSSLAPSSLSSAFLSSFFALPFFSISQCTCAFVKVRIGFLTDLLAADTWQSHVLPLVELAVDSLQEPSLCEVAAEVVGEMASRHEEASLWEVAAEVVGEMASWHEPLLPTITPHLLSSFSQAAATHPDAFPPLASSPSNATAAAALPAPPLSSAAGTSSMDEEERERLVAAFASAISDVGLAGPAHVLLSPHLRDPFATAALRCASVCSSDHRIAISLLPLWSGLSEFVSSRLNPSSPSSPALSAQDAAAAHAILLAALPLCLSHAKLSTARVGGGMASEQQQEEEEEEDEAEAAVEDYREQLEETLVDVMRAVGAANYLSCVSAAGAAPVLLASPTPQPHQLLADVSALELQLFASQAVADSDRPVDAAWACQVLTAVAAVAAAAATAPQPSIAPRLQPWVSGVTTVDAPITCHHPIAPSHHPMPSPHPPSQQAPQKSPHHPPSQQVHRAVAANVLVYLSFLPRVPAIVPALLQSLSQGLLPPTSQQAGPAGATPTPARGGRRIGRGSSRASEQATSACAAALCALCEAHNSEEPPPAAAASASENEGLAAQLVAVGEVRGLLRRLTTSSALCSVPFEAPQNAPQLLAVGETLHLARLQPKQEADIITAVASSVSSLPPSHLLLALQRLLHPVLAALHAFSAQPSSPASFETSQNSKLETSQNSTFSPLFSPTRANLSPLHPPRALSNRLHVPCLVSPIHHLCPSFLPCTESALSSLQSAFSASGPPPAPLSLFLCPPILRTTETLLSLQPLTTADQLQFSTARATLALMFFVSAPASMALKAPKGAEQQPELAEALLHLATFLLNLVPPAHMASDPSSPVLPPLSHLLQVAARGCTAAHRGVSASSFAFISALMTAGTQQAGFLSLQSHSQQSVPPLVQLCTAQGALLSHTLIAALLGPSAVSRVHKCVGLLQQLFYVCCCATRAGSSPHAQESTPGYPPCRLASCEHERRRQSSLHGSHHILSPSSTSRIAPCHAPLAPTNNLSALLPAARLFESRRSGGSPPCVARAACLFSSASRRFVI